MKINFKKELEAASKSMIMIHDPKLLIKLIVRKLVQQLKISHAGVLLSQPDKDSYVLAISRGESGIKVPAGFTRLGKESPIIRLFTDDAFKPLRNTSGSVMVLEDIQRMIWKESLIKNVDAIEFLRKLDDQMMMFNTIACVPAFYQKRLMAVLLLGEKENKEKFEQDELDFFSALASDAAMAICNAQLFEKHKREAERNRKLFLQTIMVLGSTIEAKDAYTRGHTERVTRYSIAIARQMVENGSAEFSENFFENLYIAGQLHDIGKIGVPEAILNKVKKLTKEEYEILKRHTMIGVDILRPLNLPKECIDGVRYHHENFNGTGYPEGLKGAGIPISAAIITVADAYDAMTSDRPYRKGMGKDIAIEEIKKYSEKQFNPIVAKAMLELSEKGEV